MSEAPTNDNSFDKRKLICLVKQHPSLYDTTLQSYADRVAKDRIWEEIAIQLNTTSNLAKSRWSILRSCFRREIRCQNQKKRAGKFKLKPWNYMRDMEFISPFLQQNDEQIIKVKGNKKFKFKRSSYPEDNMTSSSFEDDTKIDAQDNLIHFVDCSDDVVGQKNDYANLPDMEDDLLDTKNNYLRILSNSQSDCVKSFVAADDSLVQFFAGMLATVKTFPIEWQIKAKMAVFQQVTDLELQISQQRNK